MNRTFYRLLGVALIAITMTNLAWFALVFWAYLTTQSVISTSIIAGAWSVTAVLANTWLGSIVDRTRKKSAMLGSSAATLAFFIAGLLLISAIPESTFASVSSPAFWAIVLLVMGGATAGGIYGIALPTLVAIVVPEEARGRANGLVGTVTGVSFAITSAASGLVLSRTGMAGSLLVSAAGLAVAMALLALIPVQEEAPAPSGDGNPGRVDIPGTIRTIRAVPGLFALIFFTTINNLLGGVFGALMDAYGLTLVTVEVWGLLWAVLSLAIIFGGLYVARRGLGNQPVRALFRWNLITWSACVFFAIQPSIVLLSAGVGVWLFLLPFIEATEQTIMQTVVPTERLGRVFGFAHSIEMAASPITSFLIGPIAQLIFIPLMTTGAGAQRIGGWFGVGPGRGIALVFILAGLVGLVITLIAMRSRPYHRLAEHYRQAMTTSEPAAQEERELSQVGE